MAWSEDVVGWHCVSPASLWAWITVAGVATVASFVASHPSISILWNTFFWNRGKKTVFSMSIFCFFKTCQNYFKVTKKNKGWLTAPSQFEFLRSETKQNYIKIPGNCCAIFKKNWENALNIIKIEDERKYVLPRHQKKCLILHKVFYSTMHFPCKLQHQLWH